MTWALNLRRLQTTMCTWHLFVICRIRLYFMTGWKCINSSFPLFYPDFNARRLHHQLMLFKFFNPILQRPLHGYFPAELSSFWSLYLCSRHGALRHCATRHSRYLWIHTAYRGMVSFFSSIDHTPTGMVSFTNWCIKLVRFRNTSFEISGFCPRYTFLKE